MSFSGRRVSILPSANRRFSASQDLSVNGKAGLYIYNFSRRRITRTDCLPRTSIRNSPSIPGCPRRPPSPCRSGRLASLHGRCLVYGTSSRTWILGGSLGLGQSRPGGPGGRRRDRRQFPASHQYPHHFGFTRVRPDRGHQAVAGGRGQDVQRPLSSGEAQPVYLGECLYCAWWACGVDSHCGNSGEFVPVVSHPGLFGVFRDVDAVQECTWALCISIHRAHKGDANPGRSHRSPSPSPRKTTTIFTPTKSPRKSPVARRCC